ncbi:hypothetical protein P5673_026289 [Acropora cervicornis]|uniref:Uncharacterized protein n=1 Tax=Acropora cervicornis TaxID=6130 RepID=A0AAD9Q0R1_ACRCE|nr:hypothetical protein P5673_026289 [Acropora cervicornis]
MANATLTTTVSVKINIYKKLANSSFTVHVKEELITVHEDHFVSAPPPQKKSCEDIPSITTADELV